MRYSSRLILSLVAVTLLTAQSQSAPPAKPGPLKITEPRNAAAGFAASNPFTPTIQPPAPTREVPLRFVRHNFSAICFNTIGCRVGYNGRYQIDDAPDKVSRPPPNDMRDAWGGIEGTIRNFPPPAEVTWKSLDGVVHEAKVDFSVIFKEGLIWHNVPKTDMADFYRGPVADEPNIQLEVIDHTINVYMTSIVPTRTEQIPGNKNSFGRDDLFLVWTHTY